jgi:hypothetical protein
VVQRAVVLPWQQQDWSSKEDYEAALSAWREADVAEGFDPSTAPLLRLALFRRVDGGHDLIWTTHHLLLDGWSAARLLQEVTQNYQALAAGGWRGCRCRCAIATTWRGCGTAERRELVARQADRAGGAGDVRRCAGPIDTN